eukprot:TRINITY_DN19111_c0_g1_i1.p1 TRINITY_DN19111_c0_g1~~TRINITY_DN19111_c0_g1_i1.p1  ORF type:complete len:856 (+),score=104.11 TRINITY_DN19111_c0_g1_i1:31-2598(+)
MNIIFAACAFAAPFQLRNDEAVVTFSDAPRFGSLLQLKAAKGPNIMRTGEVPANLWEATIVTGSGQHSISSSSACENIHLANPNQMMMYWNNIPVGSGHVNASVVATMVGMQLSFQLSFKMSPNVAVWGWSMGVGPAALAPSSRALENHGFGILHECGVSAVKSQADNCTWGPMHQGEYIPSCPGGGTAGCPGHSTLSEAQAACEAMQSCTGITLSEGSYQLRGGISFEPSPDNENSWMITNLPVCHKGYTPPVACSSFGNDYPQGTYQFMSLYDEAQPYSGLYFAAHDAKGSSKHFAFNVKSSSPNPSAALSISATAADAGVPSSTHVVGYPVVLALFDGDWWDSTQIYRPWALSSAAWTQKGPVENRTDIPDWLLNTTTWVNSHWQGNDIFNTSGGDPEVVKQRVLAVNQRFDLGPHANLGLHWYEWDLLGYKQGSNYTDCGTEVTCGFDTHYPEYFPTRTGFAENLKQMQNQGVKVAPYINGRIFDIATETWQKDNAVSWAAKQSPPRLDPSKSDLSTYEESYGSHAVFNVMCPHTTYWQDVISNVSGTIVKDLGTNGVYIDQIAAAGPRPCWDKTHNHTLGGGSHWVSGYKQLLNKVRSQVGNNAVVLTESNAEPFMDGVTIFLTLVGYGSAPFAGTRHTVNAFGSIYGGYFFSMGAEFFQVDFTNPDVFSSKIAKMLLFGSQMGWFSLGGRDNQHPAMGIVNQLLDPQYTPEIDYLRALSNAKLLVNKWLTYGRATRDLKLTTPTTRVSSKGHPRASRTPEHIDISYDPIMSACWLHESTTSVVCVITAVQRNGGGAFSFTMDPTQYGLPLGTTKVTDMQSGKSATYSGAVAYQSSVAAHQVICLLFESA